MSAPKCLIVAFADRGHLNPLIAVGQHAMAAGLDVALCATSSSAADAARIAGLGGPFWATAEVAAAQIDSAELARRLARPMWLKKWLWRVLIANAPSRVAVVREAIQAWAPDVVLTDSMAYCGAIAATLERRRWISLATGLQRLSKDAGIYEQLEHKRQELVAGFGISMAFRGSDVQSPHANLVLVPPSLVAPPHPPDVELVGAALPLGQRGDERPFPLERIPADRPLVVVSFGSQFSPPEASLRSLVSAAEQAGACVVTSVKDQTLTFPPTVIAQPYIPQLALLRRAALLICHGGVTSAMEGLAYGVPLLVVPLVHDQVVTGDLIEAAGVGVVLPLDQVEARAAEVVARLLRPDAPERARAAELALEVRGGGPRVASRLLEVSNHPGGQQWQAM